MSMQPDQQPGIQSIMGSQLWGRSRVSGLKGTGPYVIVYCWRVALVVLDIPRREERIATATSTVAVSAAVRSLFLHAVTAEG